RIPELELRRQLRPRRIDLEHRHAASLRRRRLSRRLGSEKPCHWQTSSDDARQHGNATESLALHGFLLCEMEVRKLSDPSGVPVMKNRTTCAGRPASSRRPQTQGSWEYSRSGPCVAAKAVRSCPLWVIRVKDGENCRLFMSTVPQKRT